MKKIIGIIILFVFTLVPVYAADYGLKELIPIDSKTTITTDNFKYIDLYYDSPSNSLVFTKIRNLSNENLKLTFSIGLFDSSRKNIGTINYCKDDVIINSKGEITYTVNLNDYFVSSNIKYISVFSENKNCNTGGFKDFNGQTIKEIGVPTNKTISHDTELFLKILLIVIGVLVFVFAYNFMFTNTYNNMDGDDVRREYNYINKELEKKREYDAIYNPPEKKEKKKNKPDRIVEEEKREKAKENTDSSDLHNFYK